MRNIDAGRRTRVGIVHEQAEDYAALLHQHCPNAETVILVPAQASQADIQSIEILLVSTCPLKILADADNLRWLQCTNAGVDFLQPLADRLRNVQISNARGIHADIMADYAIGMITMWNWNIRSVLQQQETRSWVPKFVDCLAGKTLLVVGLGAVGTAIASRGKSAGLRVIGIKRHRVADPENVDEVHAPEELAAVLPLADYIVIAAPSTPLTRKMIAAKEFAMMKRSAFLVNVARGDLVDESALIHALQSAMIAGAALDVFETEPLPSTNPLWAMDNVIITPHIAGNPSGYHDQVCAIFSENLQRYNAGLPLRNLVDLSRGY
jgi:phosphoglycerate dehydrogenase-like enzyme